MDLEDAMDVEGFDAATLLAIAERIELSRRPEHLIYRESELDEVWRLLDLTLCAERETMPGEVRDALVLLRAQVVEAHDLIGIDSQPAAAARRLREAAARLADRSTLPG